MDRLAGKGALGDLMRAAGIIQQGMDNQEAAKADVELRLTDADALTARQLSRYDSVPLAQVQALQAILDRAIAAFTE